MTLLTVCRAVAQDSGFDAPSSIVGNLDETAVRLLSLANKSGRVLARKPWQSLQTEYPFATQVGVPSYALPTDYSWFVNDTAWNRSDYWQLRGSLSPQEWQARKSGVMAQSPRSRFRIKGNQFFVDPTPTAVLNMVIEYVSSAYVQSVVNRFTEFQTDADTVLFDEFLLQLDLTWRFLARQGLAYAEEKEEAERQAELAMARDVPAVATNLAGERTAWPPLPTVPRTGYGP